MFSGCNSLISLPDISNCILLFFVIWIICLKDAIHYHPFLIYSNGI